MDTMETTTMKNDEQPATTSMGFIFIKTKLWRQFLTSKKVSCSVVIKKRTHLFLYNFNFLTVLFYFFFNHRIFFFELIDFRPFLLAHSYHAGITHSNTVSDSSHNSFKRYDDNERSETIFMFNNGKPESTC